MMRGLEGGFALAQITAPPDAAPARPKRFLESRGGWIVAVIVWILAAGLVATVFWAVPRAASSRRLGGETASLRATLSQASAELDQARQKLASIQAQLDDLQATRDRLTAQATKNAERIAALNKRIKALEAEKKAAEAAAAVAAAKPGGGGGGTVYSVPPPPKPCITVYISGITPTPYCPP